MVVGGTKGKKADRHRRMVVLYVTDYNTQGDVRRADRTWRLVDCGDEGVQQIMGMVCCCRWVNWLSGVCDPGAARR